jgi:predicted transcriptional regulator
MEMSGDKQGDQAAWEAHLTADEAAELQDVARETNEIDMRRRFLTKKRKRIMDRAYRRQIAEEKRAAGLQLRWAPPEEKVAKGGGR